MVRDTNETEVALIWQVVFGAGFGRTTRASDSDATEVLSVSGGLELHAEASAPARETPVTRVGMISDT
jgi:hypothetical protein